MSYPVTPEQRLIKLYGFTLFDLNKILKECNNNKQKYLERVKELDEALAASCKAQISSENFLLH